MYTQMLKNQHVTFLYTVAEAEKFSPFFMWYNFKSDKWVVSWTDDKTYLPVSVAAGLSSEEAEACVIFKANEHIARSMSK